MSDWGDVTFGAVRSQDAIDALRKKMAVPTKRWDDFLQLPRSKIFTMAGATKIDLLNDMQRSLVDAKAQGQSLGTWSKSFDANVAKHGWQYNGSRAWRTRVIYETNMRTASMDARWKQMQENKHVMPYGIYHVAGHGKNRRPEHQAWDGLVLPIDDPWWLSHKPLKAYGCKCTMSSANDRTLSRKGLTVAKQAPPIHKTRRINARTGEDYGEWPVGVDVGFSAVDGWLGSDIAFGKQLMELPPHVRDAVLGNKAGMHYEYVADSFKVWMEDVFSTRYQTKVNGVTKTRHKTTGKVHTVGWFDGAVIDALKKADADQTLRETFLEEKHRNKKLVPDTAILTVQDHQFTHTVRPAKKQRKGGSGADLPEEVLVRLPALVADYKAVLLGKNGNLVYVLRQPIDDKTGKVAFNVNLNEAGEVTNSLRTGGAVDPISLKDMSVFRLLVGKLD